MTSLPGRFERDILFLEQGQIPLENSGREVPQLEYAAEEHEKLSDADVARLSQALLKNDAFVGPLDLQGNQLSDLAAHQLAKAIERPGARNLTKLDLSNNLFTSKAGIYIGEALIKNPEYPLYKLTFENVNLKHDGLVRVLEAVNKNKNILKLHCGIVTNDGLYILSEKLKENNSLEEIVFQETADHQQYWCAKGRCSFAATLKGFTQLRKVKAIPNEVHETSEEAKLFEEELKFYTSMKSQNLSKSKQFSARMKSCDTTSMFEQLLESVEIKDKNKNMPVRMFYRNTFDNLINDAIFALKKKQLKEPENYEIFRCEGSIKFVAQYCMDNLPPGEENAKEKESNDSN